MENISWTDLVKNEEVLHGVKEENGIPYTVKTEMLTGLVAF
jgi:hypothetical protein